MATLMALDLIGLGGAQSNGPTLATGVAGLDYRPRGRAKLSEYGEESVSSPVQRKGFRHLHIDIHHPFTTTAAGDLAEATLTQGPFERVLQLIATPVSGQVKGLSVEEYLEEHEFASPADKPPSHHASAPFASPRVKPSAAGYVRVRR